MNLQDEPVPSKQLKRSAMCIARMEWIGYNKNKVHVFRVHMCVVYIGATSGEPTYLYLAMYCAHDKSGYWSVCVITCHR